MISINFMLGQENICKYLSPFPTTKISIWQPQLSGRGWVSPRDPRWPPVGWPRFAPFARIVVCALSRCNFRWPEISLKDTMNLIWIKSIRMQDEFAFQLQRLLNPYSAISQLRLQRTCILRILQLRQRLITGYKELLDREYNSYI